MGAQTVCVCVSMGVCVRMAVCVSVCVCASLQEKVVQSERNWWLRSVSIALGRMEWEWNMLQLFLHFRSAWSSHPVLFVHKHAACGTSASCGGNTTNHTFILQAYILLFYTIMQWTDDGD